MKAPWVRSVEEHQRAEREASQLRSHIRILLAELERTLVEIEMKAGERA